MSELEKTVEYIKQSAMRHRIAIFWISFAAVFFFLASEVKEVATLSLVAYAIAIILDPLVSWCQQKGMRRGFSVIALGLIIVITILVLFITGLPSLIREFQELGTQFPRYLKLAIERSFINLEKWLSISLPNSVSELPEAARAYASSFGQEQLGTIAKAGSKALLRGYSIALTIVNLLLLPFFVFYLTRDLHKFHTYIKGLLAPDVAEKFSFVGKEILGHVYAFLRGQITVCLILALLYSIGLSFTNLPSAIAVGTLSGLLNIIPYFGLAIGLLLATILTFVTEPSVANFAMVYGVFVVVQFLEGSLITPKIVGESVGIHPLIVMIALIIGGQLLGLIGLIIAIPAAASLRVIAKRLLESLEEPSPEYA